MSADAPRSFSDSVPLHTRGLGDLLTCLQSDGETGLAQAEAERRLSQHGPNRLSARRKTPVWRKFLEQILQPLVVVLVIAAIVSALLGHTADALVIFAVVLVNSVIGLLQERRAGRAIAALDELVLTEASVVRQGKVLRVASETLVVGDVVLLASGDSVPADLRLLKARDLQVEEAALTGESVPVSKKAVALPADTVLGDRLSMAYAGTSVTLGRGRGLVVATGDDTETGRIAGLLAQTRELTTPLTRRIASFSKLLVWIVLAVAVALCVFRCSRSLVLG